MVFTEQHASNSPIEILHPTGRLRLIEFVPSDAVEMFHLIDRNRGHLSQYGDVTASKYPTEAVALDSILHPKNPKKLRFAIRLKDGNILIGSINLTPEEGTAKKAEIGYYLGMEFTGKGYMTEAVTMLTTYALKELGLEEIFGKVVEENGTSMKVLQNAGYVLDSSDGKEVTLIKKRD